jgi:hypothetical protein
MRYLSLARGFPGNFSCLFFCLHFLVVAVTVLLVCLGQYSLGESEVVAFFQVYLALIIFAASAPEFLLASVGRSELQALIKRTLDFRGAAMSCLDS